MAEGFSDWASEFFWEIPKDFWGKMWGDYMKLWKGSEEGQDVGSYGAIEPERRPTVPQPEYQSPYGMNLPIMENYKRGIERRQDLWADYERLMERGKE